MLKITTTDTDTIQKAVENVLSSISLYLSEPNIVADLTKKIPVAVNGITLSNGRRVMSGSVFVHQQPKVRINGAGSSVEIGDILLLSKDSKQNRRAMLLQAKKESILNAVQLELYNEWPEFEYYHSTKKLSGQTRHIKSKDIYYGAKYLLIPGKVYNNWETAVPTEPKLSLNRQFSEELTAFILGFAGKLYSKPHPNSIGWNKVIDDLTTVTAISKSKYFNNGNRGHGHFNLSIVNEDNLSFLKNLPEDSELYENDEILGLSIIEFSIVT